ncbi:MAG TPA: MauE/DoxX family redox-associated membrane protein [Polyangiaceae bacterium]|nr:MauE/DoxX family redox-associated membrane protein [Polyangiaceae bacterium]
MTKRSHSVLSTWNGHAWLALAIRLYLSWLFLSACWHKILHPESFALDVATYQLLPRYAVHLFAIFIPWLELVVGVCLLIGFRVRAAALLVWTMLLSFTIALGWALYLGLDMSCGCFASQSAAGGDAISWRTLVRDLSWLALASYVLWIDRAPIGVMRLIPRKVP